MTPPPLETSPAEAHMPAANDVVHLRRDGVSFVVDLSARRLPVVVYWGADLGDLSPASLKQIAVAAVPPIVPNDLDLAEIVEVLPAASGGWRGQPGLEGHADGASWTALFAQTEVDASAHSLTVTGIDAVAGLSVTIEIELLESGLLRQRAHLLRLQGDTFVVDSLQLALPVPRRATELLDTAGRWGHERTPQRLPFAVGTHLRDSRRGRTGTDAALILAAGTPGFSFTSGEVWAVHVAWSGNHREYAERMSNGTTVIGGGELLLPGEVRLAAGEEYGSPWVYAAYGAGLDGVSARFHNYLRSRPGHPTTPRPVVLNTWEAVYFDHDLARLTELAMAAAEVGAERYVLDDGWFRHRREDHAGLGDWFIDEDVWPEGLTPIIDVVTGLGLEFGLWFEPEMINPDSDLARAHPEWILAPVGRLPIESRHQQVLDLGHPEAYSYLLERISSILTGNNIGYIKWDHNRDLLEAGHSPSGVAGVHNQTLAIYRLLDELRLRHPKVEIEACASGGGRVDLGILERTDRIWGSDVIDPLERQTIQRWTAMVVPPELVGSHVGSPKAHTTGRTQALSFRAGTALFGHFGIEWDISRASAEDREALGEWVALYKEVRGLLHSGRTVRADHLDESVLLHGVVADSGDDALFAFVQVQTPLTAITGAVPLPGLDADALYEVTLQAPGDSPHARSTSVVPWIAAGSAVLSGRVLGGVGLQLPALHPEQLLLLRARKVS